MSEKDRRLRQFCEQGGYEGVFLRRRANVAWVTDGADVHCDTSTRLGVAAVLWTPQRKLVLTDNIEAPRMRAEVFSEEWEIREAPWWQAAPAPQGNYARDYPQDAIAPLRFSLTALELGRLRELGQEAAEVMQQLLHAVRPGWSEQEVAGELAGRLRKRGVLAPVLLVAADERVARFRHPIPTARRLDKTLLVALCAQRYGLIVALTRLVHFGRLPAELRARHDAVCRVDEALQRATVAGARFGDVLAEGIRVYAQSGFAEEWRRHHQGGPLGYEPRDFKVAPGEARRVVANQAVAWNPSIRGTKSEDTILAGGELVTGMSDWPLNGRRPDILCRA